MTRKITDAELGNIDGGLEQLQENPPDLTPKDLVIDPDTGSSGGAGGGIADDIQQNDDRPGNDT